MDGMVSALAAGSIKQGNMATFVRSMNSLTNRFRCRNVSLEMPLVPRPNVILPPKLLEILR